MNLKIQIIDRQTQSPLYESDMNSYEQALKAYQYYDQELGLDVEFIAPSINQTLAAELGMSQEQITELDELLKFEIDSHESDSCCAKKD